MIFHRRKGVIEMDNENNLKNINRNLSKSERSKRRKAAKDRIVNAYSENSNVEVIPAKRDMVIYFISSRERSPHAISVEWFLLAVSMVALLGFELFDKYRLLFLGAETVLALILIILFKDGGNGIYLLPIVIMDIIVYFRLSFIYGFISVVGLLLSPVSIYIYMFYCLFILIIYYQNFFIIERYRKYLQDFEKEEFKLKDSISSQNMIYKEELEKSSLSFENKMLEEKARLSQALHDKLGHSINGSVYQLEACKVLMEKNPQQSTEIMQGVISNLRSCMDEIRVILRREKPDKKRMAYLQLVQLCEECREKYNIKAECRIDGEDKQIPELVWEVILDNSIEAVTNALKYSKCTELTIEIIILHKVIRCSIRDNGVGCDGLKEGMGIQGMKNRARRVNGYIDITCDSGFHINMIIPLEEINI
jgi:signal transduction histidine kinase